MKYTIAIFLITVFLNDKSYSQDLLDLVKQDQVSEKVHNAFKSTRVINNHSMEMLSAGQLDFRILHRFYKGEGYKNFFGLDNAYMRLGLDYGITKNLTVGIGRCNFKKEVDGFLRYRILWQSTGPKSMPISLIWTSGFVRNGLESPLADPELKVTFARRMSYYHQLVIGRKFTERFTLQLSPILVHSNIVDNVLIPNDIYALELGARYKFTKRLAFVVDYSFPFNSFPRDFKSHPLSIGFDIETGGHVFQLHFSNAKGMNERSLVNEENGSWFDGDIQFGFNISRIFQLKKNKI